jgi:epoxide hydrolase-like predicted phosphatase
VTSETVPVDAVIFDFGGVFIDSPFTALVDAATAEGLDPEIVLDLMFGPYDQDTDHPWHRLERGEITLLEARDDIMATSTERIGRELDPFHLLAALSGGGVRDELVDFCREVRSTGVRTGLLTNNAKEFEDFWVPLLPLDELFDDVVDSSAVGLRKPDARIYELSLERLGVRAEAAVFIDDAPGNVTGAQAVGLRTVLIGPLRTDVPAALADLRAHLS